MRPPTCNPVFKIFLPCVVSLLFFTNLASAQILMQTFTASAPANNIPVTDPISIEDFNAALGNLLSVTVTLTATTSAEVDVFNNTNSAVSFSNASASIPISVTGPGNTSLSVTLSQSDVSDSSLAAQSLFRYSITPV